MALTAKLYHLMIYVSAIVFLFAGCKHDKNRNTGPDPVPDVTFGQQQVFTGSMNYRTGFSIVFEGNKAYFSTSLPMFVASCGQLECLEKLDISALPAVNNTRETIYPGYGYITVRDLYPAEIQYHAYYISRIEYDAAGNVEKVVCNYKGFTPGVGWN